MTGIKVYYSFIVTRAVMTLAFTFKLPLNMIVRWIFGRFKEIYKTKKEREEKNNICLLFHTNL